VSRACLEVTLAGERVRLAVSAEPLARELARLYGVRPRPDLPRSAVEVLNGSVRRGGREVHRSHVQHELAVYAEWAVTSEALDALRRRRLIVHAAALARRHTLLIAGAHGQGKTTLAAALALRHGWRLAADDVVTVTPEGRLVPFGRPVRIKPGTSALLHELPDEGHTAGRAWPRLMPLVFFSRPPKRLGRPRTVAFVARGAPRLTVRRLTEAMGLATLMRHVWNFNERPRQALRTLAGVVAGARMVILEGGSVSERCRAIEKLESG
jgi:hypothetical protein